MTYDLYTSLISAGLAATLVLLVVAYAIGLAASRGWHRGKREFVTKLVKDSCKETD